MNSERLRKARNFAAEFSKGELNRLCREIEAGGFPVRVQHVVRLLRLPASRRRKFLRQTIDQKWSCRQLATAIKQATGRRSPAGRRPGVHDAVAAVQKLREICEQWRRLHRVISGRWMSKKNGRAIELRPSLDNAIQKCDGAMQKLYAALGRFR